MISQGYSDPRTLARRVKKMEAWLEAPELMEAGKQRKRGEHGEEGRMGAGEELLDVKKISCIYDSIYQYTLHR